MNLVTLAEEIAAAADTVAGLRVHAAPGTRVVPPAFIVGYPELITFDATMGRGADRIELPAFVLVGRTSERAGAATLLGFLAGGGSTSLKAAIEAGTYTAADSVHVASATVSAISAEGVEYLGATLQMIITGRGA